jgi:putative oxidoreductase
LQSNVNDAKQQPASPAWRGLLSLSEETYMQYTATNVIRIKSRQHTWLSSLRKPGKTVIRGLRFLSPLFDLGIRLYLANVFFKAGLTKIANWQSTLALFENEYAVPLPSDVAAYMGTAVELSIPVLLVFGLGTRFAAIILFAFNFIATLSYPDLSEAGRNEHMYWGLLMLVSVFHGPGKLSLDHLIRRKLWQD